MNAIAHGPDAGDVSRALAGRIHQLAPQLLNNGTRKGGYWSVGSIENEPGGSLWIHLSGPKAGHWQDAATGEFGDALDLVAAVLHRGDKRVAFRWAMSWLGLAPGSASVPGQASAPDRAPAATDSAAEARRRRAQQIWLSAQASLAHTPAAAYLAGRGIDLAQLGRQPRALRFHPDLYHGPSRRAWPAMVAAVTGGEDGAFLAVHRTWLEYAGGGWAKARIEDPKMTLGVHAGGSIRLWRGASGKPLKQAPADEPVVIGEGIETCLSIALACPELRVLSAVSQGNFGSVWLPEQVRFVVLAADNDTKPAAKLALQRVLDRYLQRGLHVRIARAPLGKDFNDTLRGWQ